MTEVGARDRLVMAGLVVLSLLTVVAGVLSGRSTINYVLARDAREAALRWAGDINKSLSELGPHAPQLLDQSLEALDAEKFANQSGPKIKFAISPCMIASPACPTAFSFISISTARWHAPSGTAT
jgi:hypothetical protein